MKKFWRILIPVMVALVTIISFSGVALADDPDTVTSVTWSGSGGIVTNVDTGDVNTGFNTSGSAIDGSYIATDSNNNPYGYGVDSFNSVFQGNVTDGFMYTGVIRTDSYVPMYGASGQNAWSDVTVTGGTASMAYVTSSNYAQLTEASYGNQLPGGHNIVVNAAAYTINRYIADGQGDSGQFVAAGGGTAILDCMTAVASGVWDLTFGRGGGCYTDANFNATGIGTATVTGIGANSVTFNGMGVSVSGGPSMLQFVANWAGSVSIADYSLTAN